MSKTSANPLPGLLFACIALLLLCMGGSMSLMGQAAHSSPSRPSLSTGCGKPSAATGVLTLDSKDGKGTARKYLIQIPAEYDPHTSYSLVFVFHGWGGTSEGTRASGLQNASGAASSAIFVFPQGIMFGTDGVGWDDSAKGYDVPFFENMVREVESNYCIDKDELFLSGFSWGGDFITALACHRGDTIRAIAVNSATDEFKDTHDFRTYAYLPCLSRSYPAVRFEHAADADGPYPAPDFATTSRLFQSLNHCSAASKPVPASTPVMTCHAFDSCARTYIECPFENSIGHTLPPNWAQDTWAFFASFRKADRDVSHYR